MHEQQHVLVVNADANEQRMLSVSLRHSGFNVVTAYNAQAALDLLFNDLSQVGVILIDLHLPDLSGPQLCKRLRDEPAFDGVPIVALSEARDVDTRVRALQAGFDELLTKPLFIKEVSARIDLLLQQQARARLAEANAEQLQGQLDDINVIDLLQAVDASHRTGRIALTQQNLRGNIYFRPNAIIDADCGRQRGLPAFLSLVTWQSGQYTITYLPEVQRRQRITEPTSTLISAAFERIDHWQALLRVLPPPEQVLETDFDLMAKHLHELTQDERALCRLFDGVRTLQAVFLDSTSDDTSTGQAIQRLLSLNILRATRREDDDPISTGDLPVLPNQHSGLFSNIDALPPSPTAPASSRSSVSRISKLAPAPTAAQPSQRSGMFRVDAAAPAPAPQSSQRSGMFRVDAAAPAPAPQSSQRSGMIRLDAVDLTPEPQPTQRSGVIRLEAVPPSAATSSKSTSQRSGVFSLPSDFAAPPATSARDSTTTDEPRVPSLAPNKTPTSTSGVFNIAHQAGQYGEHQQNLSQHAAQVRDEFSDALRTASEAASKQQTITIGRPATSSAPSLTPAAPAPALSHALLDAPELEPELEPTGPVAVVVHSALRSMHNLPAASNDTASGPATPAKTKPQTKKANGASGTHQAASPTSTKSPKSPEVPAPAKDAAASTKPADTTPKATGPASASADLIKPQTKAKPSEVLSTSTSTSDTLPDIHPDDAALLASTPPPEPAPEPDHAADDVFPHATPAHHDDWDDDFFGRAAAANKRQRNIMIGVAAGVGLLAAILLVALWPSSDQHAPPAAGSNTLPPPAEGIAVAPTTTPPSQPPETSPPPTPDPSLVTAPTPTPPTPTPPEPTPPPSPDINSIPSNDIAAFRADWEMNSHTLTQIVMTAAAQGADLSDAAPAPIPEPVPEPIPEPEPPQTDPPKVAVAPDPPKTTPPKTDPPKTDPPKTTPPKTDPPKTTPPKTDPPKVASTDPPKTTPPKTDPPKTDPAPAAGGGLKQAEKLYKSGKFADAIKLLEAHLASNPGDTSASYFLGMSMAKNGNAKGALKHLEAARSSRGSDAQFWRYLGDAFVANKRNPDAKTAYQKAIDLLGPTDPTAQKLQKFIGML